MDDLSKLNILRDKYFDAYIKNRSGAEKYLWQYPRLYPQWQKFLSRFNGERILDFGSGPGFALKAGKAKGLDITGLDINKQEIYREINKALGTTPIYYDGKHIPEFEKKFDVIIFHWSFIFDFSKGNFKGKPPLYRTQLEERIRQLKAITNKDGHWYICPPLHYEIARTHDLDGIKLKYFALK